MQKAPKKRRGWFHCWFNGRAHARNVRDFEQAADAYRCNRDAAVALIDDIRKLISDENVETPNWGDAGDAYHHAEQLRDVRDALAGIGEYA